MSKLLNDKTYNNKEILAKLNEIESLYTLHNSIRTLVDYVKNDEILSKFYQKVLDEDIVLHCTNARLNNQFYEPEVYLLKQTIVMMRNHLYETKNTMGKDLTKHEFHVKGIDNHGNYFTSECISDDIVNAIQMYRQSGKNVHEIIRLRQVNEDAKCRITDFCVQRIN